MKIEWRISPISSLTIKVSGTYQREFLTYLSSGGPGFVTSNLLFWMKLEGRLQTHDSESGLTLRWKHSRGRCGEYTTLDSHAKAEALFTPLLYQYFFSSDPIPFLILVSIWFFSEPKRWSCITPSCSLTFVRESSVGWGQQFGSDHFTWLFSLLLAARILFSPSHTVHVLHRCFKSVTVIDRCTCSTDLRQISSHSSVSSPRASLSSVGYSSKRGCLKIHDHWLLNENNNV